jgi:hypothetical protein
MLMFYLNVFNAVFTYPATLLLLQLRLVQNQPGGRQYDLPSVDSELAAFLPDVANEYARTGYRDLQLYLREAPRRQRIDDMSTEFHDGFVDNFGTVLPDTLDALNDLQVPDADPLDDGAPAFATPPPPPDDVTPARYLTYIHHEHALYLPLQYVLFYPRGGTGYSRHGLLGGTTKSGAPRKYTNITPAMFYRWLLYTRKTGTDIRHRGDMLFQQFLVDAFVTDDFKKLGILSVQLTDASCR